MMSSELFSISTFCSVYNIDHGFITSLRSEGLIEITANDEGEFIGEDQLPKLELYTRWYRELGINPEGIDAIRHLIQKVRHMQAEINTLQNRLRLYETGEAGKEG